MAKVIILNAPPRSGKDTIAKLFEENHNFPIVSFKRPMFNIASCILGETAYQVFIEVYDTDLKDSKKFDFLGGMTCREFMIWISEEIVKPKFGNKHFGWLMSEALEEMSEDCNTFICSDGGFPDEVEALIDFGHEVHLVRMHRDGFNFDNDSRDYIHLSGTYAERAKQYDINMIDGNPEHSMREIAAICNTYPVEWNDDIPW